MPAGKSSARNPKVARFTVRLDDKLNARLERLADAAGQNKGVMASLTMAAGLRILEGALVDQLHEARQAASAMASAQGVRADVKRAADALRVLDEE